MLIYQLVALIAPRTKLEVVLVKLAGMYPNNQLVPGLACVHRQLQDVIGRQPVPWVSTGGLNSSGKKLHLFRIRYNARAMFVAEERHWGEGSQRATERGFVHYPFWGMMAQNHIHDIGVPCKMRSLKLRDQ